MGNVTKGQPEQHQQQTIEEQPTALTRTEQVDDGWTAQNVITMTQIIVPLLMLIFGGYYAVKKIKANKAGKSRLPK